MTDRHEFALFFEDLSSFISSKVPDETLTIKEPLLWQRMVKVLRANTGDTCILFDRTHNCRFELLEDTFTQKRVLHLRIIAIEQNTPLTPSITLCPALLKKHDFQEACYLASAMGVTRIIPLLSSKVARTWEGEKEHARLEKIMIAASEQAKQFVLPKVVDPIPFASFLEESSETYKILFDPAGSPLFDVMGEIQSSKPSSLMLTFGPEGDLTSEEKSQLTEAGFVTCALTPTVLRAVDAVAVGVGSIRSISFTKE